MLSIQSRSHDYTVRESANARAAVTDIAGFESAYYLIDRKVAELYKAQFADVIPESRSYFIDASEHAKSYEQLEPVFCWLLEAKFRRSSTLVVIGGGVLQDIGCFVASVLARGVRWTLIPTTLLAQCDSCIGSKSSININRFKNQLGTFYPPHEIRLSFDFLKTLTPDEIYSGLGEAIKLHLIDGQESAERLRRVLASTKLDRLPVSEIVWASLKIKKKFIEEDEFDGNIRNVLNYGHTFAHALESATNYAIPHGIAVIIGMVFATYFAERLNFANSGYFDFVLQWTKPYFAKYITAIKTVALDAVVEAMRQDKKNVGDQVTFILSSRPGMMEKVAMDATAVPALMQDCRNLL
jgi:3-dehydroquinate synthase